MFGKQGANCDNHTYFPDLRIALNRAWLDHKGIIAVQRYGYEIYKQRLGENFWPSADILHHASIKGELAPFIEALEGRKVIMVGPKHLHSLGFKMVYVPLKNAWTKYEALKAIVKSHIEPGCVVLYSCGMMAEVFINELYSTKFTQIDTGSVFDPYCGVRSRRYHFKLEI